MNELLGAGMILFCFSALLLVYRFFGKTGLFVWIPISVIVANIQVQKTVELFGITCTLGNILYASSFTVTDILSENYGKKEARKAVLIGFFSLIFSTVLFQATLLFTPASSDWAQEYMNGLFSLMPRLIAASVAAFAVSQTHDVWSYHFWKRILPEKKWIFVRNNMSSLVSQALDTLVFVTVAFYGLYEGSILFEIFLTTYTVKAFVTLCDTPLVYAAVRLQRFEKP
ncbi:MAG: queuosine precursor transporter [Spirochaetia bacterium]|nr:queuosine precursor transporter [Spirochaetia bacterium]